MDVSACTAGKLMLLPRFVEIREVANGRFRKRDDGIPFLLYFVTISDANDDCTCKSILS